ncbi:MAG: fibronectin type III domain-containing protein, partial [Terriglobia bacterium]
ESFRHNNNGVVFPDALDARLLRERAGRYAVYGVKAVNKKGQDAGYSNLVATQLYPVAAPLARIATRVTERAIELRWQAPARTTSGTRLEAIAGYEIYRSETGEPGSFALHGTAPTGFYEDTQFRLGARYYYFIRTLAQFGADTVSSASSLTVEVSALDLFPPPSPTGLVAVGGPARVDLTWEASPAADLAGYYLYRSRAAGAGFERLNQRPVVGQSLADTGVEPGLTYYYVVTAVDADGNESEFSEEAAATPLPAE